MNPRPTKSLNHKPSSLNQIPIGNERRLFRTKLQEPPLFPETPDLTIDPSASHDLVRH
jgi:hypothetical protein